MEAYSGNSETKRSIKRMFCLTTKELNRILRGRGGIGGQYDWYYMGIFWIQERI